MAKYEEKLKAVRMVSTVAQDNTSDVELTPFEISTLNSIPLYKKCDYQFVRTLLKILFKSHKEELCNLVMKLTKTSPLNGVEMGPATREKIAHEKDYRPN